MPLTHDSYDLQPGQLEAKQSQTKEFCYIVAKKETKQLLPSWTGYHKQNSDQCVPQSRLHYLPNIDAPPNEMTTISHILQLSIDKAESFELDGVIVVFDQALYSKAQQIRWKNEIFQRKLVLRLGKFHTCMAFMGAIGKMYRLSGLEDILVEGGVVAQGSIAGVMGGHNYYRSLRAHKIMYEALSILLLQKFIDSLDDLTKDAYYQIVESILSNNCDINSTQLIEMQTQFASYIATQSAKSPMFSYWSAYIRMVEILLMFIRATRESNWNAHVSIFSMMLPYFFALDRQNYAR